MWRCGAHSKSNILSYTYLQRTKVPTLTKLVTCNTQGLKMNFIFLALQKSGYGLLCEQKFCPLFYATINQPIEAGNTSLLLNFKRKRILFSSMYTWSANDLLASVHLTLSPESPSMSIVALVIFLRHESASSSSSYQQITLIKSCSTNLTHNTKLIVYVSILQAAVSLDTIEFNLRRHKYSSKQILFSYNGMNII